jgi:hypothetical protein
VPKSSPPAIATDKGFLQKTNGLLFFRNSYENAKFLTANGFGAQLLLLTNAKSSESKRRNAFLATGH